jgi:hypothetical protein
MKNIKFILISAYLLITPLYAIIVIPVGATVSMTIRTKPFTDAEQASYNSLMSNVGGPELGLFAEEGGSLFPDIAHAHQIARDIEHARLPNQASGKRFCENLGLTFHDYRRIDDHTGITRCINQSQRPITITLENGTVVLNRDIAPFQNTYEEDCLKYQTASNVNIG